MQYKGKRNRGARQTAAALDEIEPELRQLDGLLTVLVLLGETSDSVEPIALSSLGRAARDAFDAIKDNWRKAMDEIRLP